MQLCVVVNLKMLYEHGLRNQINIDSSFLKKYSYVSKTNI